MTVSRLATQLVFIAAVSLCLQFGPSCGRPGSVPIQECGNDRIEGFEQCDGDLLGGATCESLGAIGGVLGCDRGCAYDLSGCSFPDECGNALAEAGEDCDGTDLGGATCQSLGYGSGSLTCSATCIFDESDCL